MARMDDAVKVQTQQDILLKIRNSIINNQSELVAAKGRGFPMAIAWLTRNLLELSIWAEYCRASVENAERFTLDVARDAYDALDIPDEVLSRTFSTKPLREELLEKSKADGIDIEASYTRVSAAAKVLGQHRQLMFKHMNKTLSKLAHPTAFAIVTSGSDQEVVLASAYYNVGQFLANVGLIFTDLNTPVANPYADHEALT